MTGASKRKGNGYELEVVRKLQDCGLAAAKVPLSGAVKTSDKFDHDITVPVRNIDRKMECKRRKRAFGTIYGMLGDNYALAIRDDHTPSLVVLRLSDFAELAK